MITELSKPSFRGTAVAGAGIGAVAILWNSYVVAKKHGWRAAAEEIKFVILNALFLGGYFVPFMALLSAYGAWKGKIPRSLGAGALSVVALDAIVPLPKPPYVNTAYARRSGMAPGLKTYCDGEIIWEAELEKDKQYMVCFYPHGLWPMGFHLAWPEFLKRFGITPLVVGADVILKLPLLKRHFAAWGTVSASRKTVLWALQQKFPFNVTCVTPGGIAEMFYGVSREQIILRKRKGFVKLALQTGAQLVPTYGFGVNQQFRRFIENGSRLEKISRALQLSITPWFDRFWIPFGFVPTGHKMIQVVGQPIPVERVEEPTEAQVDALHAEFCTAMQALFDKHKAKMGWEDKHLFFDGDDLGKKTWCADQSVGAAIPNRGCGQDSGAPAKDRTAALATGSPVS